MTTKTFKTFKIFKKGSRKPLAATVTLRSDGLKATLNPNLGLRRGATYIIKLTPTITDLAGNPLVAPRWTIIVN